MANFSDGTNAFNVDRGLPKKTIPSVIRFKFGDGYEQRLADGINPLQQTFSVTLRTRTSAEIDNFETFLEGTGGVTAVAFNPPDLGELLATTSFSGTAITVGSGFNASVNTPVVPDRLVVSGTVNNDGSHIVDSTGTNNDTTLTVIDSLVTESSVANVTVAAGYAVIAIDWNKIYDYDNFYSLNVTLKRVYEV